MLIFHLLKFHVSIIVLSALHTLSQLIFPTSLWYIHLLFFLKIKQSESEKLNKLPKGMLPVKKPTEYPIPGLPLVNAQGNHYIFLCQMMKKIFSLTWNSQGDMETK